jgi:hypothetical protein
VKGLLVRGKLDAGTSFSAYAEAVQIGRGKPGPAVKIGLAAAATP